jgi:hypothetical protein
MCEAFCTGTTYSATNVTVAEVGTRRERDELLAWPLLDLGRLELWE